MKAFQLKIVIKKTQPPVWKRCIIPAGITFSQLAVLLNEIMGWTGQNAFLYEFYHRRLQLKEKGENEELKPLSWKYDLQDASLCYINEYLEQEDWFSYNLENGITHRITIEKVITDYPYTYAQVMKSKGIYPVQTDHEITTQFSQSQGKTMDENFCLEEVNAVLKTKYNIHYAEKPLEGHKETYDEICSRIAVGILGLPGTHNPNNDAAEIKKSSKTLMKEFADKINLINFASGGRRILVCSVLKESLEIYTKTQLRDYAEKLNLKIPSSIEKQQLMKKIADELLSPRVMEQRICLLTDEEIELFEQIASGDNYFYYGPKMPESLLRLHELNFAILYEGELAEVPLDVWEAYESMNTPQLHEKRKMTVWMLHCLDIVKRWYGAAPMSILKKLYHKNPEKQMKEASEEKIQEIFQWIPEYENPCCLLGDKIIAKCYLPNHMYLRLEQIQKDKKFYVPSWEEAEEYVQNKYPVNNPAYRKLKMFMEDYESADSEKVEEILCHIYRELTMGNNMSNIIDDIMERDFLPHNKKIFHSLLMLLQDVNNSTRMLLNRGYTPDEIALQQSQQMENKMGGKVQPMVPTHILAGSQSKLREKTDKGEKKIYPNDPCPCGSGKKYKKCCGRNGR